MPENDAVFGGVGRGLTVRPPLSLLFVHETSDAAPSAARATLVAASTAPGRRGSLSAPGSSAFITCGPFPVGDVGW
ncbi:hypothetical protein GCM10022207_15500 [Streptomyces lannensis]|uniref:Uncharacterized protein n=1 Tax=Streptomyces lannensis TaxID=766498 RepID=A0ABP7JTG9_9ACTN